MSGRGKEEGVEEVKDCGVQTCCPPYCLRLSSTFCLLCCRRLLDTDTCPNISLSKTHAANSVCWNIHFYQDSDIPSIL